MNFVHARCRFGLVFIAAVSFGVLPGCGTEENSTIVTESEAPGDHDAEGDDHAGHDHDAEGDAHAGHDHGAEGDDHAGHDHGAEGDDHAGHDHGAEGDEHAGHSHDFDSVGAAAKEIETLYGQIKTGMEKDDIDAAHDPLHHLFSVLVATEDLLKKQGDAADKSVKEAVETLFEKFTAIDKGLHGGKGTKFADVKDSIENALETLKKAGS